MTGLVFAFLLLVTVMGYIIIKTDLNPFIKAIVIIVTTWYSIALYAAPGQIAGHPKMVKELPDQVWIIAAKIIEPSADNSGGMYFWVYEKKIYEKALSPNPLLTFQKIRKLTPRAYGIPYDKEMHKKFEEAEAQRKAGRSGRGGGMQMKYNKGSGGDAKDKYEAGTFEIFNPSSMLPPKD